VRGNIRFEEVSFSYPNGEPVLKNINLEIQPGEKIAVIGANGSGKTTIINLLLRFYTPGGGRILLDGMEINELNLRDYRRLISVVSQDLYLFNATVTENITLFSPMPDFKVYQAAQASRAHEFIAAMPRQYASGIGPNGAGLSGGERQKIAMARAFARDSQILVLDEATSNYDFESENQVNELFKTGFENKTVIMITHRPDVLKQVGRIIVLEKGCIADIGTHEELYRRSPFYQEMLNRGDQKKMEEYGIAG
jgi:ATP-binding cassette subfamily B protein